MQDKSKEMMNHSLSVGIFAISIAALLILAILSLIAPDQTKSQSENRGLAQFPQPTWESVLDGSWMTQYESYSMDQFAMREQVVRKYFSILDTLQVKERNGFVRGTDDCIVGTPPIRSEYSQKSLENYSLPRVDALNVLKDTAEATGAELISLQIPHKNEYFADSYPRFYPFQLSQTRAQREYLESQLLENGIDFLDVSDILLNQHKEEYIYFYTDNHWTFLGAYYTYQELLTYINRNFGENIMFPEWEQCDYYRSPDRSVGTYLKKYGDSGRINNDYLEYILPKDMPDYIRFENGKESNLPIVNDGSSYTVFMAGDRANTVVKTGRTELPNILYIGFSYTNALEVLSIYSFNEIHSLDPRYYTGSLSEYVRENAIDYVVVLRDDVYENNPENKATIQ